MRGSGAALLCMPCVGQVQNKRVGAHFCGKWGVGRVRKYVVRHERKEHQRVPQQLREEARRLWKLCAPLAIHAILKLHVVVKNAEMPGDREGILLLLRFLLLEWRRQENHCRAEAVALWGSS